jgi:hypothetical protein
MDYFIGKQFQHCSPHREGDKNILYTIYKEDFNDHNLVWINWKENLEGVSYAKADVEIYFKSGIWVESIEPFKIEIE